MAEPMVSTIYRERRARGEVEAGAARWAWSATRFQRGQKAALRTEDASTKENLRLVLL